MDILTAVLAAAALVAAATAAALYAKLAKARAALAEALKPLPAPPPPPRAAESRREHFGLLWFPVLTVRDDERLVVGATAGMPHCAKCVRPLALNPGPPEEWACGECPERRPGSTADLQVTDSVIAEALGEFLRRNPGYRAGPALSRFNRPLTGL